MCPDHEGAGSMLGWVNGSRAGRWRDGDIPFCSNSSAYPLLLLSTAQAESCP